jgi:hypothetical protein
MMSGECLCRCPKIYPRNLEHSIHAQQLAWLNLDEGAPMLQKRKINKTIGQLR